LSLELEQQLGESFGLAQRLEVSLEPELAGGVKLEQSSAELGAENLAYGAHREKPASLFGSGPSVLGGQAATTDQAVEVGVVHEVLAPGMQDGRDSQLGGETLLAKLEQCGGGALEQQIVEWLGVVQGQGTEQGREREDPVKIAHGQERLALAL
jgi:hypothetical protein